MADLAAIHDLTAGGTSIQEVPAGIFLEITRGLNEPARARGEDVIVPHKRGRTRGSRVADVRSIELEGVVMGLGETVEEQQASFRTLMTSLRTLFDPELDPWALAGVLEDASTATIDVAATSDGMLVTEVIASLVAEVKIALESIDPDWVITPAGP